MRNFNIKRQINKLYTLTTVSYFGLREHRGWRFLHSEDFHCYRLEYWRVFSISQAVVLRSRQVLWQMFWKEKDAGSFEAGQCAVLSGYDFI